MIVVKKVVLSWCTREISHCECTLSWLEADGTWTVQSAYCRYSCYAMSKAMTAYLGLLVTGLRFFQIRSSWEVAGWISLLSQRASLSCLRTDRFMKLHNLPRQPSVSRWIESVNCLIWVPTMLMLAPILYTKFEGSSSTLSIQPESARTRDTRM